MEEEFTGPVREVVREAVGSGVPADVEVDEKDLVVLYPCVAVLEVRLTGPEGFYLRAVKHNARLDRLKDEVIVIGLSVLTDWLHLRPPA